MSTPARPLAGLATAPASHPARPSRAEVAAEWRANWRRGAAIFLIGSIGIALWASLSSLFIEPMQKEFGWTRSQFAFAFNSSIIVALLSPMIGRIVDRKGARFAATLSVFLLGLGYIALGLMWNSLPAFYVCYVLTMVVATPSGGMSLNRAVSQTFIKSRGTALAITRSGTAIAAAAMPPVLYRVIADYGWRMGFMTLAALLLLIALPLCYFFLPRERTVVPLAEGTPPISAPPATIRSLVRNPKIVFLCAAAGLGYAPCIALLQTFQPILIDKGIEPMTAATLIGAMGASAFFSGLAGGVLVDRLWAPLVTCAAMMAGIAGCLLIMPAALTPGAALLGTISLGVAQGTQIQIVAYLIGRYMGLTNFSTIFGIAVMVIAILVSVFINLMTRMHEAFGSHVPGLSLCIASFTAGMIAAVAMGSYPREEPA